MEAFLQAALYGEHPSRRFERYCSGNYSKKTMIIEEMFVAKSCIWLFEFLLSLHPIYGTESDESNKLNSTS